LIKDEVLVDTSIVKVIVFKQFFGLIE